MHPDDSTERWGARSEGAPSDFERLYRRRLRDVLGINGAGAEVILRLRNQVIALQDRIRQLEAELAVREAGQNMRLIQHRETYFEVSWQEMAGPATPEERP